MGLASDIQSRYYYILLRAIGHWDCEQITTNRAVVCFFFFLRQLWVGRSGQDDDNDRFVAHLFQCRRQSTAAIGALFCPCADCNRLGYYIYARACACAQSAPQAQSACPDYIIIYERRQASAHACILCFRLCAVAVAKLSTLALQPPLASICILCLHFVSCIS